MEFLLEARGLTKGFPGVVALSSVDFNLRPGEVHVLLGENGAGKSTLVKILTGIYKQDEGEIVINGREVSISNPIEALDFGITAIHQELALVPYLDVATNIFLGRTPGTGKLGMVARQKMHKDAKRILESLEVDVAPEQLVSSLGMGKRQLVEIAKALSVNANIIFMDEPTSALSLDETEQLFEIIRELKAQGIGVVYISHKLEEVHQIGDRITVLRDGVKIDTGHADSVTVDDMVRKMVGREVSKEHRQKKISVGDKVFEVRGLAREGVLRDISFSVRAGEILGVAGLVGAGRSEMTRCIFGIDPMDSGEILINGTAVKITSPSIAVANGLALLPENRKHEGLFPQMTVEENIVLPAINARQTRSQYIKYCLKDKAAMKETAQYYVDRLRIRTPSLYQKIVNLSGGNQQKAILAKWLALDPKVIIFDEPTRGIDVGSKSEIYDLMEALLERGIAIVMVSSELPEVLAMADRIIVLSRGRLTGEFHRDEATEEKIMACAVKVS